MLLILASVSITVVFGDNGILQLAKEAGEKTNEAVKSDLQDIQNIEDTIGDIVNNGWSISKVTAVTSADGKTVPVPKGFVGSGATGENTVSGGFVIYEGTEPVTNTNVATAREERNQFVWVPVDGEELKYEQDKETWKDKNYVIYKESTDMSDTEKLYERQTSVKEYGGFYVGRYEAGVEESKNYNEKTNYTDKSNEKERNKSENVELPVTKKGRQAWNYISQENAKKLSEKMYESSTSVTSRLIDSQAWDTICHWFENNNIDVKDSASWGNYVDADSGENVYGLYSKHGVTFEPWKWEINTENYSKGRVSFEARELIGTKDVYELATGISERNKAKNIYDMAGNMWEVTTETGNIEKDNETIKGATTRGCCFGDLGSHGMVIRSAEPTEAYYFCQRIPYGLVYYVLRIMTVSLGFVKKIKTTLRITVLLVFF